MRPSIPVLVATLAVSAGCISLGGNSKASCEWLEVEASEGFEVSGPRRLTTDHWGPHACGTVDTFKLARGSYILEMWNGHQTYPWLFLKAANAEGTPLRLESPDIQGTSAAGKDVYGDEGMQYQYVFRAQMIVNRDTVPKVFPFTLTLRVVTLEGVEIGRESFTVLKKTGHYFFREI